LHDTRSLNHESLKQTLFHLAICHSIIIDERTGKYNASSPDELALVNAAKFFGCEFVKRDEENIIYINYEGHTFEYRLLNILEFTSTRKRMSVIVEDLSNKKIFLFTKGADSIILEKLNFEKSKNVDITKKYIEDYAIEGLRTLLLT
jgi:magnesium-transporting ATPase (P-type)